MILKRQGYDREMPHAEETDPSIGTVWRTVDTFITI